MNAINPVMAGERSFGVPPSRSRAQTPSSQVWAILEGEQRQELLREMLALLCPDWRQPSMVLNPLDGSLAYANRRCLHLLMAGEVMRLIGGRLDFRSRAQNRRFRDHLRDVANGVVEGAFLVGRVLETGRPFLVAIHRPRGFPPEALEACFSGASEGLCFVTADITLGASLPAPAAVNALSGAFGLSRAEAHLMQLFASGLSLHEAAARRGITVNTARQQMKAVLNKTNCDRQQDLMRLIFSMCPGHDSAPLASTTSSAAWKDSDDKSHSRLFGYGCIDANAAVASAMALKRGNAQEI